MDSSALLEESHEVEMEIPREGQEELNINELNSFLNSIIIKCKSKISYCRQAQNLIGNIANAKTEISILKKANENLQQTNEQLKGHIQSASNENLNLKNKNEQFNKEIEELMENKRQNELLVKGKKMKLKRTIKEFALYKQRITS